MTQYKADILKLSQAARLAGTQTTRQTWTGKQEFRQESGEPGKARQPRHAKQSGKAMQTIIFEHMRAGLHICACMYA